MEPNSAIPGDLVTPLEDIGAAGEGVFACVPSFAQQRLWFLNQLDSGSSAYNVALTFRITGPLDSDILEGALTEIIRRHESLRTTFDIVDSELVQIINPAPSETDGRTGTGHSGPLSILDLREIAAGDREAIAQESLTEETRCPFDLKKGPLFRAVLWKLGPGEHNLMLNMHHIVADGWSFNILRREMGALYKALHIAMRRRSHTLPERGQRVPVGDDDLPELPIQYADYAEWQRSWLKGDALESQFAYWTKTIGDPAPALNLPTDYPRPAVLGTQGAVQRILIPADLVAKVKALSESVGSTTFMTYLTAFKTLLYRLSGQTDIWVGTPVAGRTQQETENLIGCFINTLVLRTDLSGPNGKAPAFVDLLRRVREVVVDAFVHQDTPFEALVDRLDAVRDRSRNPLFQAMMIDSSNFVQPLTVALGEGADQVLEFTPLLIERGASMVDITLFLVGSGEGLKVGLEYNTDLFNHDTATRLLHSYLTLLESAVTDPSRSIDALDILTPNERRTLLVDWNDTQAEYPKDAAVHTLVEEQARRTPEAVAVVFGDQKLTYRELDCKADALAKRLQTLGVAPEVRVALFVERSLDMVIGMLGIAKAGGAYVPLDPDYPAKRIEYILADARAPVIVTQAHLAQRLAEAGQPPAPCRTVLIDRELPQTTDQPATAGMDKEAAHPFATSGMADCTTDRLSVGTVDGAPSPAHPLTHSPAQAFAPSPAQAENLAYVIYTSGSTGNPKGVQITHRALVNLLCSMRLEPGLSAADSLAAVTTLCFDIAGLELWLPLITGARIVIVGREVAVDGERLAALLERERVTVMQATPATWRLLLEAGWKGSPALKILCGGEAFPRSLAQALLPRCASLWNVYGPTETTIWSTALHIVDAEKPMSIGHPIANTQVYILDANQNPQPIGVPGELYIGGDGLARGYLNLPELTAEKFVPFPPTLAADASANRAAQPAANPKSVAVSTGIDNPKSGRPGEAIQNPKSAEPRLYRTGDLARRLADGTIEFLGRLDNQVKIRGFRIELGEIENRLRALPGIRQAVVTAREDTPGDKRLVAYLVAFDQGSAGTDKASEPPDWIALRTALNETLPDYMLPSACVWLEALPQTANGKIDQKALPAPDRLVRSGTAADPAREIARPLTATEATLVRIWETVLRVSPIGIHDDFFELGGHSLVAIRLFAEIERAFNTRLPLSTLFQSSTIEKLANLLYLPSASENWSTLVPINPRGSLPPFFCVHAVGANVLNYRLLSRHLGEDQPFYGFQAQGMDGLMPVLDTVEEMAAQYLVEVRKVQRTGPYYIGGASWGGTVAFEMARQLAAQGERVALVALLDTMLMTHQIPARFSPRSQGHFRLRLLDRHLGTIVDLTFREQLRFLLDSLSNKIRTKLGGQPAKNMSRPREALTESIATVKETIVGAMRRYQPKPYSGKVAMFLAEDAPDRTRTDLRLLWGEYATGGLEVYSIPGEHADILEEPHVGVAAARLRTCLESVVQAESGRHNY